MQDIEELGVEIEEAWRRAEYRSDELGPIAQAALERRTLAASISIDRIFRWLASSPQIPHQPPNPTFGEPPIQLFAGRRFYVEALFWTDGTTAIHQHGFSGAFQVLLGGSIHTTYTFNCHEQIDRELLLGELNASGSELLRAGDVRPIVSGDRFIHSLFHLERPSVTLIVRSRHDAGTDPQYSYLSPGIAYNPFARDDRLSRLLQLLDVLDHRLPETTTLLASMIERADLCSAVAMLLHWSRRYAVDSPTSDALLAIVARRHGRLATMLRSALQEARRQALIIHRRRHHHRVEHRFLLSLLLNVGSRSQILALVQHQYPSEDPVDRIMAWIQEMVTVEVPAVTDASCEGSANAIRSRPGEYDLGDVELTVLRQLMRQRTPEQIVSALAEEYDDVESQRSQIMNLCVSLTSSALFKPLFRSTP